MLNRSASLAMSTSITVPCKLDIKRHLPSILNLPVQIKMAILSRRLMLLATLLYEQCIQFGLIFRQKMQFLNTKKHAPG